MLLFLVCLVFGVAYGLTYYFSSRAGERWARRYESAKADKAATAHPYRAGDCGGCFNCDDRAALAEGIAQEEATILFLEETGREVARVRAKFPHNRHLLPALQEEVGELARAFLDGEGLERRRAEAVQVAALALRLATEGDAAFDGEES